MANENLQKSSDPKKKNKKPPPVVRQTLTSMYRTVKANPLLIFEEERRKTIDFSKSNLNISKCFTHFAECFVNDSVVLNTPSKCCNNTLSDLKTKDNTKDGKILSKKGINALNYESRKVSNPHVKVSNYNKTIKSEKTSKTEKNPNRTANVLNQSNKIFNRSGKTSYQPGTVTNLLNKASNQSDKSLNKISNQSSKTSIQQSSKTSNIHQQSDKILNHQFIKPSNNSNSQHRFVQTARIISSIHNSNNKQKLETNSQKKYPVSGQILDKKNENQFIKSFNNFTQKSSFVQTPRKISEIHNSNTQQKLQTNSQKKYSHFNSQNFSKKNEKVGITNLQNLRLQNLHKSKINEKKQPLNYQNESSKPIIRSKVKASSNKHITVEISMDFKNDEGKVNQFEENKLQDFKENHIQTFEGNNLDVFGENKFETDENLQVSHRSSLQISTENNSQIYQSETNKFTTKQVADSVFEKVVFPRRSVSAENFKTMKIDFSQLSIRSEENLIKPPIFRTPMAYMRRSVVDETPKVVSNNTFDFSQPPQDLDLINWLEERGEPIANYHHLRVFDEENKENVEEKPEDVKSSSYEDLNIEIERKENPICDAKGALEDLLKLILDGYPLEKCEGWLTKIKDKSDNLCDEPLYWECRAAIERSRNNISTAIECYKTAIVKGAEVRKF